jgi:phospholipid/cholesterol/gamma-HCH transport system substrate-binding protein
MKTIFSKEAKIGIAFIVALLLLYAGIHFLKGINVFKPSNSYTVMFDDVTGLTLSTPVLLSGYQVGLVYSMNLDEKAGNKVAVVLNLNKGIKIAKGSKIKLDVSLMGSPNILIEPNPLSTEYYDISDQIPGIRNSGLLESMGQSVLPGVGNLVPKLDSILTAVNKLVNDPNLPQTLENINAITADLTTSTKQLNQLMASLNKDVPHLTDNMAQISDNINSVSGQLKTMDIQSTYKSLDSTMKNIEQLTQRLNSKENSLGLLLNDKALYDSLNTTLGNAGALLKDVKENPSKYINVKVF